MTNYMLNCVQRSAWSKTITSVSCLTVAFLVASATNARGQDQLYRLNASDARASDNFGWSVALSGTTALVGAVNGDVSTSTSNEGEAYVYVRGSNFGDLWDEEAKLSATGGVAGDDFGHAVDLASDGDIAIIGAPKREGSLPSIVDQGTAYVFDRSGTTWSQVATLTASNGGGGDEFGYSVAADGDYYVVGAPFEDTNGTDAGAVYVFVRAGTVWAQDPIITPSSGAAGDRFGWSVAIDGDTIVVGAPKDDNGGSDSGAVFAFQRISGSWTEQTVPVTGYAAGDELGRSVTISGDRIAAGAWLDDWSTFTDAGSAYVFDRTGTTWSQTTNLTASNGDGADWFGTSVALEDDRLIVGAQNDEDGFNGIKTSNGTSYFFEYSASTWSEVGQPLSTDGESVDLFGTSVSISGDLVLAGAHLEDSQAANAGSAYLFVLDNWPTSAPFCYGTDLTCPCGNGGNSDAGCDNAQSTGGVRLTVTGFAPDGMGGGNATLYGSGFPSMASPAVVPLRGVQTDVANPLGDGLSCISGTVVRLTGGNASGGTYTKTLSHGAGSGVFFYQFWYRNTPISFCDGMEASNGSSGHILTW